jgi:hypothetical protein
MVGVLRGFDEDLRGIPSRLDRLGIDPSLRQEPARLVELVPPFLDLSSSSRFAGIMIPLRG